MLENEDSAITSLTAELNSHLNNPPPHPRHAFGINLPSSQNNSWMSLLLIYHKAMEMVVLSQLAHFN